MLPRSRHPSAQVIIDTLRLDEQTRSVVASQNAPSDRFAHGSLGIIASMFATASVARIESTLGVASMCPVASNNDVASFDLASDREKPSPLHCSGSAQAQSVTNTLSDTVQHRTAFIRRERNTVRAVDRKTVADGACTVLHRAKRFRCLVFAWWIAATTPKAADVGGSACGPEYRPCSVFRGQCLDAEGVGNYRFGRADVQSWASVVHH